MTIKYCTPAWLEESAKLFHAKPEFEEQLKKVTARIFFRIKAEPAWGIDKDVLFGVVLEAGKLLQLDFFNEEEARQKSDFVLGTTPQEWKAILRKEKKFITEFLMGKVTLEEGSKPALLKITPYANHLVDALTQFEIQYPDEMSPEELEAYRSEQWDLQSKLST